ncbi:MAG: hypothetical protein IJJ69_14995 [Oscillospiraceae bacterium]|nr:hypothetical protein [Oscillospiraceae bacterium]
MNISISNFAVTAETEQHKNILIAYFSRAGENYNVGVVKRRNTERLAENRPVMLLTDD